MTSVLGSLAGAAAKSGGSTGASGGFVRKQLPAFQATGVGQGAQRMREAVLARAFQSGRPRRILQEALKARVADVLGKRPGEDLAQQAFSGLGLSGPTDWRNRTQDLTDRLIVRVLGGGGGSETGSSPFTSSLLGAGG